MPLSHDVKLPIAQKPEWPAICIRCGREYPDSVFRFRSSRVGWDQILTLGFALGSRPRVEIPACAQCVPRLRNRRWIGGTLSTVVTLAITVATIYLLERFGYFPKGPYRRYMFAGIVLIALMPQIIWEVLHPRIIDTTAANRKIKYEFRDATYARLFAELNDTNVI